MKKNGMPSFGESNLSLMMHIMNYTNRVEEVRCLYRVSSDIVGGQDCFYSHLSPLHTLSSMPLLLSAIKKARKYAYFQIFFSF